MEDIAVIVGALTPVQLDNETVGQYYSPSSFNRTRLFQLDSKYRPHNRVGVWGLPIQMISAIFPK